MNIDFGHEGWGLFPNQFLQQCFCETFRHFSCMPWHPIELSCFRINPFVVPRTVLRQDASSDSQSLDQFRFFHEIKNSFVVSDGAKVAKMQ